MRASWSTGGHGDGHGTRRNLGDSNIHIIVNTSVRSLPGSWDVPHDDLVLLHGPLLVVAVRAGGVGDGDQVSGGVDVAVLALNVSALPGLLLGEVGLELIVTDLVAEVVGGVGVELPVVLGLLLGGQSGVDHSDRGRGLIPVEARAGGEAGGGGESVGDCLADEGLELGGNSADHLVRADLWSGLGEAHHHQQLHWSRSQHCVTRTEIFQLTPG